MLIIKRMNRCFDPRHSSDIWKSMSENIALKPSVSFSRAAVTNYHTFGGLKQQKFTHSWGSVKSEIKVPGGVPLPPKPRGENPFLHFPASSGSLPSLACESVTPVSAPIFTLSSLLSKTPITEFRAHSRSRILSRDP